MLRIVVLASGGGTNLQAIIDEIEAKRLPGVEIAGVISNNQGAFALERAKKQGIVHLCVSPKNHNSRKEFEQQLLEAIEAMSPDLIVLAGFLVVLPQIIIKKYQKRIINIHPSLIPAFCGTGYYGLKVHEAALKRGVRITGATVHFVDEGTDTGPILLQKAVEVKCDDTPQILQLRVMQEAEWKILPQAIAMIASGKTGIGEGERKL